jgi:NitT/TauT family transport system ATP-binding protein
MLEAVGLGDSLHLYPAQMSGGMQQRLAIAQALIKRPRILLLDEPFGALDPGIRADMHVLITKLWREFGLTIIMVTHDIREAFSLGTRVLALDKRRHDPHAPTALAPRRFTTCPCAPARILKRPREEPQHERPFHPRPAFHEPARRTVSQAGHDGGRARTALAFTTDRRTDPPRAGQA